MAYKYMKASTDPSKLKPGKVAGARQMEIHLARKIKTTRLPIGQADEQ